VAWLAPVADLRRRPEAAERRMGER
jgi:hypothetical protein